MKICTICDSSNTTFFANTRHTYHPNHLSKFESPRFGSYFRCRNCGLIFQSPIPPLGEMEFVYDSNNYYSFPRKKLIARYLREKKDPNSQNQRRLRLIEKYIPPNSTRSLIDIGSGYSILVKLAAERGWDAVGIEPSEKWVSEIKRTLHPIEVFNGYFHDYLLSKGKKRFSVVSMFDVIEHVNDPLSLINDIKKVIYDDSVILLLSPNAGEFMVRYIYKSYWQYLLPHEHINLFTPPKCEIISW